MTRNEAITRLLSLSTQLEADGKDMSAMACTYAAAQLMLLPNQGEGDEIGRAAREVQEKIERDFDQVQAIADMSLPSASSCVDSVSSRVMASLRVIGFPPVVCGCGRTPRQRRESCRWSF